MIQVRRGELADAEVEGVVRPVRADLSPVNVTSRDLVVRAGSAVEEHLTRLGSLPLGGAVITPAGDLACDFLIHVVVMSEDEPQTSHTLQRALQNGLRRASDWGLGSLALPPLGIGVGTIEPEAGARALAEILFNHLDEGAAPLAITILVTSDYELGLFERLVEELAADRA